MENFEQHELPQIRSKEIFELVNQMEFTEYKPFKFNGTEYQLIWLSKEHLDEGGDVFFSGSTQIDGFDIYILESLSEEEKKKRIFHEILEADLIQQGIEQAHDIALAEEEKLFGKR